MDGEILQGEIEAAQGAIISLDERLDELEEEQTGATVHEPEATPPAPTLDLAQTVGRLEAEVTSCQAAIAALTAQLASISSEAQAAQETASVALETVLTEPEPVMEEVVTVEPEPESSGESEEPEPNWLERMLLGR